MPELAEVVYYAKQWNPGLGQTVRAVQLHRACRVFRSTDVKTLAAGLQGSSLKGCRTHGKQMLLEFATGRWLTIHLGMTGELSCRPVDYEAGKHDHLVLSTPVVALVFTDPRQFGAVRYTESEGPPADWLKLPPQPLDAGFTAERLSTALQRHCGVMLKALLLDQRYFPGIGNWMADEVLWQMRLPPQVSAGALGKAKVRELRRILRQVCRTAIKTVGQDWGDLPKNWLFRHRWGKGGKCPRCGTELVREEVRGRTACWCPVCQRE